MVHDVDGGVLRLISPYFRVRLESAPADFAIRASSAIDDAPPTAARTPLLLQPVLWSLK